MFLSKPCSSRKRKREEEGHVLQGKWKVQYLFSKAKDNVVCLICQQTVSVCKGYNVRRRYEIKREDMTYL
jgi:hypothetical protein